MATNYFLELSKIVPEALTTLKKRILILKQLNEQRYLGRRSVAQKLALSERVVRAELEHLKNLNLVTFSTKGVAITNEGKQLLRTFLNEFNDTMFKAELSKQMIKKYRIKDCIVVAGNRDTDANVIHRMGEAITFILDKYLPKGRVVLSVSGGTTMSNVVQSVNSKISLNRQITVVPARGGGHGEMAIQSNMVSHLLAQRVQGESVSLFVPEQISEDSANWLLKDPSISKTIHQLKQSNCLIYSVGNATIMAERRGALAKEIDIIQRGQAVGEALGTFFDKDGNVVYRLARLGIGLEDLPSLPCEVLVVCGAKKYKALSAYMKLAPKSTCIVIDEALAKLVLKEETLET